MRLRVLSVSVIIFPSNCGSFFKLFLNIKKHESWGAKRKIDTYRENDVGIFDHNFRGEKGELQKRLGVLRIFNRIK